MRRPYIALILALAVGPASASLTPDGDSVEGARHWPFGRYRIHLSDPGSYLNCRDQPGLSSRVHAVLGNGEEIEAVGLAREDALWLETALGCFVIADTDYVRPVEVMSAGARDAAPTSDTALRRIGAPVELAARTPAELASPPRPQQPHPPEGAARPGLENGRGDDLAANTSGNVSKPATYATQPVLTTDQDISVEVASAAVAADTRLNTRTNTGNEPSGNVDKLSQSTASDGPPHWLPGTYAVITRQPRGRVNCRDLPSVDSAVFVSMANGDLFDVTYVTKREQPWLLTEHECFVKADDGYLKAVRQDVPRTQVSRRPLPVPEVRLAPTSHANGTAPDERWSVGRYSVDLDTPGSHLNCRDMPSTRATVFRKLAHGTTIDTNFIVHTNGVWLLTTHECFIKADANYLKQPGQAQARPHALPPSGSAAAD